MYVCIVVKEKTNKILIKFLKRKYFGYCLYQFTIFLCTNIYYLCMYIYIYNICIIYA